MNALKKLLVLVLAAALILPLIGLSGCTAGQPSGNGDTTYNEGISDKITFVPGVPFPATVGVPYSFSFSGGGNPSGGHPPYSFTLGSGEGFPPMGIILSVNGLLSGTPKVAGTYEFQVSVKDLDGNQTSGMVSFIVNPAPQEGSKVPNAYVYSGTLSFTIKEQRIPTYKNRGMGIIDNASDENSMTATVNFSNLRLTWDWNPNQEDYMRGTGGGYKEDFQFSGSVVIPDDKVNVQDSFSGSFDEFAIIGEYVPLGVAGENGILITLLNPEDKDFPSPLSPYWSISGSPYLLNNAFTTDLCYGQQKGVLFFEPSGGTVNFSGNIEDTWTNSFWDYSGTLTLILTRTE